MIYHSSPCNLNTCVEICEDLTELDRWCDQNKMHINYQKTKFMCFGTWKTLKDAGPLSINVNGEPIEKVTTYKYLGVVMDERLTFNDHVKKTIKCASHKLFLLRKVRPMLTTYAALQLFKAMILPVIEYGNILYDTASKQLLSKLQTIQNNLNA